MIVNDIKLSNNQVRGNDVKLNVGDEKDIKGGAFQNQNTSCVNNV